MGESKESAINAGGKGHTFQSLLLPVTLSSSMNQEKAWALEKKEKKATALELAHFQSIFKYSSNSGDGKESAPCSLSFQWRYWTTEELEFRSSGCWSVFLMIEPLPSLVSWLMVVLKAFPISLSH